MAKLGSNLLILRTVTPCFLIGGYHSLKTYSVHIDVRRWKKICLRNVETNRYNFTVSTRKFIYNY